MTIRDQSERNNSSTDRIVTPVGQRRMWRGDVLVLERGPHTDCDGRRVVDVYWPSPDGRADVDLFPELPYNSLRNSMAHGKRCGSMDVDEWQALELIEGQNSFEPQLHGSRSEQHDSKEGADA